MTEKLIVRCGWFGEGRGQCLLREEHKGHHTCQEDGRLLEVARTGLAAACEQWREYERCTADILHQVQQIATNGWGTSGANSALAQINRLLNEGNADGR